MVSALNAAKRILDLVLRRELRLAYDDRIPAEYEDVLRRSKFRFAASLVDPLLDAIRLTGTPVERIRYPSH